MSERTLYLLATNGKLRKVASVTVDVKILADALQRAGLVGSHANTTGLPNGLTSEKASSLNFVTIHSK